MCEILVVPFHVSGTIETEILLFTVDVCTFGVRIHSMQTVAAEYGHCVVQSCR